LFVVRSRSDIKKRAEVLDDNHPGSSFAQELASYRKYFVLISGPFANSPASSNSSWTLSRQSSESRESRDLRPHVIFSMHKPGIDFFSTGAGWLGGLRKLLAADAMMSLLVPASDDFDFLPPLILDFPFRGTNRSLNVSGA